MLRAASNATLLASSGTDAVSVRGAMAVSHGADISQSAESAAPQISTANRLILHGVEVIREGGGKPFLGTSPTLASASVQWAGTAQATCVELLARLDRLRALRPSQLVALPESECDDTWIDGRSVTFTTHRHPLEGGRTLVVCGIWSTLELSVHNLPPNPLWATAPCAV
jgi:hypothetical protein